MSGIDVLAIRMQQVSVGITHAQAARLSCERPSKSDKTGQPRTRARSRETNAAAILEAARPAAPAVSETERH